ncbi:tetratricopeptide repeat protein [bacterium]
MTIWRWVGIGLFALMLGCTGLSTQNGDTYFSQKEYQKAMQAYIQSMQVRSVDGKRYIRYSPEIMTKIGISALNMDMWAGAIKVFTHVNNKTPSYGAAYFYLGMCYERQGKFKQAQNIYSNYSMLSINDPGREAMKGRLYYLKKQQYIKEAKMMAARGPGDQSGFPTQRMVVLDFHYDGSDLRGTVLSLGLASLVIDDLNRIGGFQVVPRERIYQLMQAMGWQAGDLNNVENLERIQKLLKVGTVIHGKLQMAGGGTMKISQRTLTFTGVRHVKESDFNGKIQNIMLLQKKIVLNILKDLDIQLTSSQTNILKIPATRSLKAFLNYAYALYALDHSQYYVAQDYLKKAIEIDPDFVVADQITVSSDIFDAVQSSDWMAMQKKLNKIFRIDSDKSDVDFGYDAWVNLGPIDRLQEMGRYLDAGFIPGSDSREAFEELDLGELMELFPDFSEGLPDPPNPPESHYPVDPWYLPDPPPPPHRP